jgi:hypothetical protein
MLGAPVHPQPGSTRHASEQPSPPLELPSSHSSPSPESMAPFPQWTSQELGSPAQM